MPRVELEDDFLLPRGADAPGDDEPGDLMAVPAGEITPPPRVVSGNRAVFTAIGTPASGLTVIILFLSNSVGILCTFFICAASRGLALELTTLPTGIVCIGRGLDRSGSGPLGMTILGSGLAVADEESDLLADSLPVSGVLL